AQPGATHHAQQAHPLRVGEAANRVGVRVSAVHFWEQQDLVHPRREPQNRYRLYDEQQIRRLRVVALLRDAGYRFTLIRSVLHELAAGRAELAIVVVEKRSEELTRTGWCCIAAMTLFSRYVSEFGAQHGFAPH